MNKIPTIFARVNNKITNAYVKQVVDFPFANSIATEKLDGTNVRLTIRNHILVRLEKRFNPSKQSKEKGIIEPWYIDAQQLDPSDAYIWEAARNTKLEMVPDGEWSGEAVGPKIQGNPLNLNDHRVMLFSLEQAVSGLPVFENVPITFEELKVWLPQQKSKYGNDCGIEGVVWHAPDGRMAKIKTKDFRRLKDEMA